MPTTSGAKIEHKFTDQILWDCRTKVNTLCTAGSTAWHSHHIEKWAQSVHSRRNYSKKMVFYQLTKKERRPDCRAKFEYFNDIKYSRKHTCRFSTLTEDSKTLTFAQQIGCFVVTKFGSSRFAQKIDFFQNWALITFRLRRFEKPAKHCQQDVYPDFWANNTAQILTNSGKMTEMCVSDVTLEKIEGHWLVTGQPRPLPPIRKIFPISLFWPGYLVRFKI